MIVRDAVDSDLPDILEIYNDAVLNTTAIWNEVEVDVENRRTWLKNRQGQGFPVIVSVNDEGRVTGYASFGDWRAFDGYRHTVEHSVYVNKEMRGAGIGKILMLALIERARRLGKHVMIAGIEANNEASIQLHKKLGFETVGYLPEVGTKFGKWLDLAFLQITLDKAAPR
ncbi:GNAT family N-acetyltransferase [Phyllobacterium zundukense]|uniref:GNAT family N-acetyltransferase n=1 Tax=Phyllobacterium zundukense TaxID=1867719 RepID=A0A2N9VSC5_9HYPH|nr:GNAT family N-acetyltransferase [Phyllobacterium zundukense]ATU93886.1 GNAT family N-acetyltransferase [Phyllobacterium zundukense]PIO42393.1 GNAT family N-acetyltransferase [Phyllobacterium zundukense]